MQHVPQFCENKLSSTLEKILILLNSLKWYYISKSPPFNYQWRKNKIALETQGEQTDSWNFGEMSVVFGFIFKGKKNFPLHFINTITFLKCIFIRIQY